MDVLVNNYASIVLAKSSYIAGGGDGIVTVAGKPASRRVWLLNAQTLAIEAVQWSLSNGHYMFLGLNPDKHYLVIVRDYKKECEPFVWDNVIPADDLTIDEQMALQASWQT